MGCTLADEFTACRLQSSKMQSAKNLYSQRFPVHELQPSETGMEIWGCPLQVALLESHLHFEPRRRSRAAARSKPTRVLISMVNRSRRDLNYRAEIIPSGFGCQQQPRRGRAAPRDRRSSTEPTASAAFACAMCRACGQRDPGWGSAISCRASGSQM